MSYDLVTQQNESKIITLLFFLRTLSIYCLVTTVLMPQYAAGEKMQEEESYVCSPIGTGLDDGFFSIEVYLDQLYAGGFGYRGGPAIYRYPEWEVVRPGLTVTESVCELREYRDHLYANTESEGKIYRSRDGEHWELVFDGEGTIGCVLREFRGHLYATIHSSAVGKTAKIYRTHDGLDWEKVYDSGQTDEYMKELVEFQERFFAFYVDKTTGQGGYLTTVDGLDWHKHPLGQVRLFKALIHENEFWASSTAAYTHKGISGIWKFDGETFVNIARMDGYSHLGELIMHEGKLFVTATRKWKGFSGGAALLVSADGGKSWRQACVFQETESWNVAKFDGDVFVTSKQHLGGGKLGRLYKVNKESERPSSSVSSRKTD